ncbi:MAG: NAD+ synthase [Bacteroidetes bacterium]|nr:NAD+ synthase [Bacteroidota bacterium]
MKIALAQVNYLIGDFEGNTRKILNHIEKAKSQQADLVVFAELSICGYPPRDFLEFDDFIHRCYDQIELIAAQCKDIAVIVGAPSINPNPKGKPLYNTAFFLANGKIEAEVHKTLLPTYDIFDEYRYFEPNRSFSIIPFKGKNIALTICEDLWNISDNPLYIQSPMDELALLSPDVMINIAASPFHSEQAHDRLDIMVRNTAKYQIPLVYVNHVGAQTELLFDGGSMVVDKHGVVQCMTKFFEEDFCVTDIDALETGIRITQNETPDKIALIHDALVMGIRDYFKKLNFGKAILGLSGGIDSAVTLALAAEALGAENVRAVLLPSRYSSEHSIDDAVGLAKNLGCQYDLIPIDDAFSAFEKSLEPVFNGIPFGLAEENIQARTRAVLLMGMANKLGYILLNTSNKSEAAVGYGTLYGDMCGGISVLGDVYKTDVFKLAWYINRNQEIIPENSITKPPSAELRPDQKDSDSLPEYDLLDQILYLYIEKRQGPTEIIAAGYEAAIVNRVLKMVNSNEWKRQQTPPILRVSYKAFGSGRRMPIVARYLL